MKLIEGDRGKLYLQIEHEERAPFYLMLGQAWLAQARDGVTDRVDREFPTFRSRLQRILDELKKKIS